MNLATGLVGRARIRPMNDAASKAPRPDDPVTHQQYAVARMIDASANRLTEALRVIEDYARYGLDDRYLVTALKTMRHEVTVCIQSRLDTPWRMASRDTLQDVGTDVSTDGEMVRADLRDVAAASYGRAQQAARSLEECLKTMHAESAAVMERIRYRLYTLQKAMLTTARSQQRLRDLAIYAIVDGGASVASFESTSTACWPPAWTRFSCARSVCRTERCWQGVAFCRRRRGRCPCWRSSTIDPIWRSCPTRMACIWVRTI